MTTKPSMTDDEKQGRRFTITTARHQDTGGFTATMRCAGRKTTWAEWRRTEQEAIGACLNYLRNAIRPYVRINPPPKAEPVAVWTEEELRLRAAGFIACPKSTTERKVSS